MKSILKKIIGLVGLVVATLVVLNVLTPTIYKALPNDYVRTGLILDTLEKGIETPSIVIFGNSRGMSGINGMQLEDSLGIKVYNFCSPSQSLMESVLFYEKLPEGVQSVIQCIDEREFNDASMRLKEPARLAFSMAGYELGEFCSSIINPDDKKALEENHFIRNIKARTSLKTGLSHLIVKELDEDAPTDGIYRFDYPYMYPSDSAKTYERDLNFLKQFIPDGKSEYPVEENLKTFLTKSNKLLTDKGINTLFVLMPIPPALEWPQQAKDSRAESVRETVAPAEFINCLDVLESSEFYDPVHPNRKGSVVITNEIISFIKGTYY